MENKLMSKNQIVNYIFKNLEYFPQKDSLYCEEIGDGNINYVFRIVDRKTERSLVVKQSDVLLRSSLRPLDIGRSSIEKESLVIKNKLAKGFCPEVYLYDKEKSLIVMEDISDFKNLRKEIIEGRIYSDFPENISDFLAKTLLPTTDLVLSRKEKKQRVIDFTNPDMCDISEDLVFTEPYFDYKGRNIISSGLEDFVKKNLYDNKPLQKEVLILKDKFQNQSQALVHGDLHSGSIFVNERGIKVIDPEFSFYGPIGYDYGNVWGNLVFPLVNAIVLEKDEQLIKSLKNQLVETIDKSIDKLYKSYDEYVECAYFKNEKFKENYLKEIVSDSFGYGGCEIIRRTVGDSKVSEITSVKDKDKRVRLDKSLIEIGMHLILSRKNLYFGKDLMAEIEKIIGKNL
ncbi:MAG: S-methyl-5-thioribose kinase [Anaerococcus sp.]